MSKKLFFTLISAILIVVLSSGCAAMAKKQYVTPEEFEVYFYPKSENESMKFAAGSNSIQIITNSPTTETVLGNITIYNEDGTVFQDYDIRTTEDVYFQNDTDNLCSYLICLTSESFQAGRSYYVTMGDEVLYVDDIQGYVPEVKKGDWVFHIANYGIEGNINDILTTYLAGDTISIPVAIADECVDAFLVISDETVASAEVRRLDADGSFELEALKAGTFQATITFLDQAGEYLDGISMNFTVK